MINEEIIKRILREKLNYIPYIKRNIDLININKINKIISIIGPRRAGKTYLMYQIIDTLISSGIDNSLIAYMNFEDDRLSGIESNDLQKILDIYYSLYPDNKNKTVYFFFDEIQNAPLWSKFVRRLNDKENCRIFITGSSSKMLSKEIATELRGRTYTYEVFPFSLEEYLLSKGIIYKKDMIYSNDRYKLIKHFQDYLINGGFPETINLPADKRISILQEYYEVVLFRDIIERHNITSISAAKDVFKILSENISRTISTNKIYNDLKSLNRAISKDFIYDLISFIEETMYYYFIPIFTESENKKMANPKKIYAIDNGLINSIITKPVDIGWLYENLVAIKLISLGRTLFYYNGKNECDFISFDRIKKQYSAIQVTYEINKGNKEREVEGIIEAMEILGLKEGIIITNSEEKEEKIKNKKIKFVPLWRFLLEEK